MSILKRIERLEKKLQKPIKYVVRWQDCEKNIDTDMHNKFKDISIKQKIIKGIAKC